MVISWFWLKVHVDCVWSYVMGNWGKEYPGAPWDLCDSSGNLKLFQNWKCILKTVWWSSILYWEPVVIIKIVSEFQNFSFCQRNAHNPSLNPRLFKVLSHVATVKPSVSCHKTIKPLYPCCKTAVRTLLYIKLLTFITEATSMASCIILCTSGLNFFASTASLWVNSCLEWSLQL